MAPEDRDPSSVPGTSEMCGGGWSGLLGAGLADSGLGDGLLPLDACACLQGGNLRRKLGDLLRLAGGDGGVGNLRRRNGLLDLLPVSAILLISTCSVLRCPTSVASMRIGPAKSTSDT